MNRFHKQLFSTVLLIFFSAILLHAQEKLVQQDKVSTRQSKSKVTIRLGNLFLSGDVRPEVLKGYGLGIGLEQTSNFLLKYRFSLFHGTTYGLDLKPTSGALLNNPNLFKDYGIDNEWFYNYCTKYSSLDFGFILNISDLAPRYKNKKLTLYTGAGIGLGTWSTKLNLLDDNDRSYSDLMESTFFDSENEYNTIDGRNEIRQILESVYDNTYETPAPKEKGLFRPGNETNLMFSYNLMAGFSYQMSSKLSLRLEHEIKLSRNDYLDGKSWLSESDRSSDKDILRFTSLGISLNISRAKIQNDDLNHWDNLKTDLYARIDSLTEQPKDSDLDGVIDEKDKQPNSMSDCPVDKNGVTLDSDKDGIPDCIDSSPYIDENQLNNMIARAIDASQGNNTPDTVLIETRVVETDGTGNSTETSSAEIAGISLPVIFFDYNSSELTDESLRKLIEVYMILRENDEIHLNIYGHSSEKGDEAHNLSLSADRASSVIYFLSKICMIDSSRFKSISLGENEQLINSKEYSHLNQRVELKLEK